MTRNCNNNNKQLSAGVIVLDYSLRLTKTQKSLFFEESFPEDRSSPLWARRGGKLFAACSFRSFRSLHGFRSLHLGVLEDETEPENRELEELEKLIGLWPIFRRWAGF